MSTTWVKRGALHNDTGSISVACNHRKSGACGGCYARVWIALKAIEMGGDGKEVVASAFADLRKESES